MTGSADMPAWLQGWQQRQSQPQQAAALRLQPQPARPKVNYQGFVVPEQWENDGGHHRASVLDYDHNPPRVVRVVGWRRCMACSKLFWSDDVVGLRLCDGKQAVAAKRLLNTDEIPDEILHHSSKSVLLFCDATHASFLFGAGAFASKLSR